jgi:PadR family transcriptional regulator PadR
MQGTLDLLILRTLVFGPAHGHAIARDIRRLSEEVLRVETGSLYPALHRLEASGFIAAAWEISERGSVQVLPIHRHRPKAARG